MIQKKTQQLINQWRLLDTGILPAATNMALDEVLLEAQNLDNSPPTLRFLRFDTPSVLLGFHQCLRQEIRSEYCQSHDIAVNRRITGGGTIIFEPSHLGWEVICRRNQLPSFSVLTDMFEYLCKPMVKTLNKMGIQAQFRPRNDIEVNGRKLSGTGGTGDSTAYLFQGTLLVDLDIEQMLKALRIPVEKLKAKEIDSVRQRITTLKELLPNPPDTEFLKKPFVTEFTKHLNIEISPAGLSEWEKNLLKQRLPYYESNEWINRIPAVRDSEGILRSNYKAPGGLIRIALKQTRKRIQNCMISGDFFAYPSRFINDLENSLKDCATTHVDVNNAITKFFTETKVNVHEISTDHFTDAIMEASSRSNLFEFGFSADEANAIFPVNGTFSEIRQKQISTLLLPYCAKKIGCKLRYSRDCNECGNCSISDGYSLGRERDLKVITIISFEDLIEQLQKMKNQGVEAYIGCCCEPFFVKHREDFEAAELPGILININNNSCYDLDQVEDAYNGKFTGETQLDLQLLKKVMNNAC